MTNKLKRVVITGMGAITPIGNSVDELWGNIVLGKNGVDMITKFDTSNFKTKFAAEVKGFIATDYFKKSEVRKYDLFTQYAVAAADEAVKNANLKFENLNANRIGVIWGSGNGGMMTMQNEVENFFKGNKSPRFNPHFISKTIADIPSGVISIRYGLRGLNFSTVSACASSNTAICDAFNYIRWGKADIIITGGSEAAINESCIGGFNAARALSTNNENPQTACKPFDITRDGFVLGEGAGALVLESLDSALSRGANIIAEMAGAGMAADAYHLTSSHPQGEGAYLGMLDALNDAEIEASEIDYINAHATSTTLGDDSEMKAIMRVFHQPKTLHISSTKSMTGHLLGAAGAVEAIITTKAIQKNVVPPTINTTEVVPEWKEQFNLTIQKAQAKNITYAMSNTFGFGGHIATAIFKKYDPNELLLK
ncbi:MAG: beta-ketoacyl-ACP synthase II [Gemmatimonadaceae bacterium]|nr:beta-ketoacyl-ACP synthase II [Chitinophagaceae bacterium]